MGKEFCINIPDPISIQSCNIHPCVETSYNWVVTTEWSVCSASCGRAGTQYQLYYCAQEQDGGQRVKVDDLFCSDLTDPKEPRPCNRLPCVEYNWISTDEWEECSELCGENGIQRRKVQCQRRIGEDSLTLVGVRHCLSLEQPSETRNCNRMRCYGYKWEESEMWSACSTTCNDGMKIKLIVCKNVSYDGSETLVDEQHCNAFERPEISMKCNNGPCVKFRWILTDNWTECSAECGISGTKTRIAECHQLSGDGSIAVNDTFCSEPDKEVQIESCNRKPCYSFEWNVGEWSSCSDSCINENNTSSRTRKVHCIQKYLSGQYEITEPFFCDEATKPVAEESCKAPSCSVYRWNDTEMWSDCSKTCGDSGFQTQLLQCVEDFGNGTVTLVDEHLCANMSLSSDPESRICKLLPCVEYRYLSFRLIKVKRIMTLISEYWQKCILSDSQCLLAYTIMNFGFWSTHPSVRLKSKRFQQMAT